MWGNGMLVGAKQPDTPLLDRVQFRTGDDGRDLFDYSCRSCHQWKGYRPIKQAFDGTDAKFIEGVLAGLHTMRAPMPPFQGTAEERATLAAWLAKRIDHRPLYEIYGVEGQALGRKVYETRCQICHVPGGHADITGTLAELDPGDFADLVDATDMAEEMPVFTGDAKERAALIEYLQKLGKGGGK
jgi:mono/diheme cytochrome c family protein